MIHIIETVTGVAARTARTSGISPLPQGVSYTDPVYGMVVDYFINAAPDELFPLTLYACRLNDDGSFEVLQEAPDDFVTQHGFSGWPPAGAPPDGEPLE